MKIECLIKRKAGTRVTLDAPTRNYHFKPTDTDERHLADVSEASHIAMLLRIKDGYRAADESEQPDLGDTRDQIPDRVLKGSTIHAPIYEIKGGDNIELSDLVDMAFEDSGLSEEDWNDLPDQERYEYIDTTLAELRDPPIENFTPETAPAPAEEAKPAEEPEAKAEEVAEPAADAAPEELDRDEWVKKYKALYGRNPAKALTAEQIKRAVEEA